MCVGATGHLQGPLEVSVGHLAVGEAEALGLARLAGQLPQHLHRAVVQHLGEEGRGSRDWGRREITQGKQEVSKNMIKYYTIDYIY